jgi:putative transposase
MLRFLTSIVMLARALLKSRRDLALENLALRQQLAILKAKTPRARPRPGDRLLWVLLRRFWPAWRNALIIVQPETVIRWHRERFRRYWRRKSRSALGGRPHLNAEIRDLVRRLACENPTWGAPRVHGKLRMLGFDVSERAVSRYMPKRPTDPQARQGWITFLHNHRDVQAAMDFFTVPTVRFRMLYVLFVIHHARRKILHLNVTANPSAAWICQQLREAFPYDQVPRYLIFDRDSKFDHEVVRTLKGMGVEVVRTAYRSPWQNGVAERWVQSVRQDLLDHVIVMGERHLGRLLRKYVRYYHRDRCHLGLGKNCQVGRRAMKRSGAQAKVIAFPRLGGLHHRYEWRTAA